MSNDYVGLVSKVWNYAHVLRDEGIAYGDYLEQITYLLFLKMDDERENLLGESSAVPDEWKRARLRGKRCDELELQYRHTLENLSRATGMLGTIFRKAQNKVQDPAKLSRLVAMIDEETWLGLRIDVKGAIYEGLLERNAEETKSGAGQYFTPRALIDAIVDVMRPNATMSVHDPACGTGGFFALGLRVHEEPDAGPGSAAQASDRGDPRRGNRRERRFPLCHEPLSARHRRCGMPDQAG